MDFATFEEGASPLHPDDNPLYPALGLGGETGELLNLRKKIQRDGTSPQLVAEFVSEGGDILFYLAWALQEQGKTLNDAAAAYFAKKQERRGTDGHRR